MPPYLAGRQRETDEFLRLLSQDVILANVVLTGLRGVGKTVLLDTFKPVAIEKGWMWVGSDLSESASISEERLALRLITDLSVVTSTIVVATEELPGIGFRPESQRCSRRLDFETLEASYRATPGLVGDKLKAVLELVWPLVKREGKRGIVLAYDEAQNLSDHALKEEYPLSLLLDLFQSIQSKDIPLMLMLVGLPTLFPKLVEARTFAERMFRVLFLDRLSEQESREAILRPLEGSKYRELMRGYNTRFIVEWSGGYPYFIQFMCREVIDLYLQLEPDQSFFCGKEDMYRKLDTDFYAGRWARTTDRQRELLTVIAHLESCEGEFSVQEVVEKSKDMLSKPFSPSHVSQMLVALAKAGLVYKNRHGRYSFAVPLLGKFILRQQ